MIPDRDGALAPPSGLCGTCNKAVSSKLTDLRNLHEMLYGDLRNQYEIVCLE